MLFLFSVSFPKYMKIDNFQRLYFFFVCINQIASTRLIANENNATLFEQKMSSFNCILRTGLTCTDLKARKFQDEEIKLDTNNKQIMKSQLRLALTQSTHRDVPTYCNQLDIYKLCGVLF